MTELVVLYCLLTPLLPLFKAEYTPGNGVEYTPGLGIRSSLKSNHSGRSRQMSDRERIPSPVTPLDMAEYTPLIMSKYSW